MRFFILFGSGGARYLVESLPLALVGVKLIKSTART